jgi:phosphoglycolate phosphatase
MLRYRKKPIPRGFVVSTDIFEADTPMMIRMLEGDSRIKTAPDIYLMIGVSGEVYPIKSEKFHSYYKPCNEPVDIEDDIYTPNVKNETTGEIKELIPYMKSCISFGEEYIYAEALTRNTKVFNSWNPNGYMYGREGDFLAIKCDNINDVYIIYKDIFAKTYEKEKNA